MYKVINGKGYSTETARMLASKDNGLYPGDLRYLEETLYIKRTGEYFLHGAGGAGSRYGEWSGNSGRAGEAIIPLSLAGAREWAEGCLDGEEYERIFGSIDEAAEGGGQQQFSILVPAAVMDALKAKKEATGHSVTALILRALRDAGYGG
ncbi:MAG: hypothetical protein LBQ15_03900 [Clostridium sp.]|jgi:hypothetical protein|nr:hypothetical protein [Clostridium sp.]